VYQAQNSFGSTILFLKISTCVTSLRKNEILFQPEQTETTKAKQDKCAHRETKIEELPHWSPSSLNSARIRGALHNKG